MKKIVIALSLLISTSAYSQVTQKLSTLPLGSAATTHAADSFPYTDSNAFNATKRLTLWDLANLPPFASLNGSNISVRTVSASTPILLTDNVILVDASGGAVTLTALTAASMFLSGKSVVNIIKKIDSSSNPAIVVRQGSDTIDGQVSRQLDTQWALMEIFSSGGNLYVK